jgi:predicted nucleic acid-binding protein
MPGSFFDTNVLLYVASGDSAKSDQAEKLIGDGGIISVQVLNEIANVARRRPPMSRVPSASFFYRLHVIDSARDRNGRA